MNSNWFPLKRIQKQDFEEQLVRDGNRRLLDRSDVAPMAEGMTVSEELRIILDGDIAKPGFGMMQDRGTEFTFTAIKKI